MFAGSSTKDVVLEDYPRSVKDFMNSSQFLEASPYLNQFNHGKHYYARLLRGIAKRNKRKLSASQRKNLKMKRQAEIRKAAMAR